MRVVYLNGSEYIVMPALDDQNHDIRHYGVHIYPFERLGDAFVLSPEERRR